MNLRTAALLGVVTLVFSACPADPTPTEDGGTSQPDAGTLIGGCSGGCGENEVCDEASHQCVPGCNPACGEGELCVKNGDDFSCTLAQTACNGTVCGPGETTCVQGNCSCQTFPQAIVDTCAQNNQLCHVAYNPVTQEGGGCEDPSLYEYCGTVDCQKNKTCGTCGAGQVCDNLVFTDFSVCVHSCGGMKSCATGELCAAKGSVCYPASIFGSIFACSKKVTKADGGTETVRTSAPDVCVRVNDTGIPTETTPSGTCTWATVRSDTAAVPISYCRAAGPVPEFGACKTQLFPSTLNETCGSGLECAPTKNGEGICQRICNAKTTSAGDAVPPKCAANEACANLYRRDDDTVVGACVTTCNVFEKTAPNFGCPDYGSHKTSCIPTTASGNLRTTTDGSGLCIAQRSTVKAEGEPCEETDAFKGAACQSGLVCMQTSGASTPTCVRPCDAECSGTDGGAPPARCATEANATCSSGKTCSRTSSLDATVMGLCL